MEKLSETERARVSKTSNVRIVTKLIQSGVNIDEVEAVDRAALLTAMAILVLSGKESVPAAVGKLPTVGYDAE